MRKTKLQAVEAETDLSEEQYETDLDEIIEKERPIKETKYNNLLSFLKDFPDDYEIWLYKKGERNKRFCVAKYDSYIPDPFADILPKYGGGEYRLLVRANNKLIDTADINLLEPGAGPGAIPGAAPSSRADLLNEMKLMADIFKGGQAPAAGGADLSKVMLEITKIQIEQARIMSENQQKSEQRITQLILEMQSKKPALSEIMDVVEFVDNLKHGAVVTGEGETTIEKLINSPIIAPIIQGIISKAVAPSSGQLSQAAAAAPAPQAPPVPMPPVPATVPDQAPVKLTAENFFPKIPQEFKDRVKQENRDDMAKFIYDNNQNVLDYQTAADIIELILKEKSEQK